MPAAPRRPSPPFNPALETVPREKTAMSTSPAGHKHPYHLVDPSPWPIIGALFAGTMFGGTVLYMHGATLFGIPGPWVMAVGIIGILAIMAIWWRDVIFE